MASASCQLPRFERSHIDGEAVLHIRLEQPLISFVDLLDGDDFDVSGYIVFAAEVGHLLGFGEAADEGQKMQREAANSG